MTYWSTFIDVDSAAKHLDDANWLFVDTQFELANPTAGYTAYTKSHLPGAVYADLDQDLSGTIISGTTGRHPLPNVDDLASLFASWGVTDETQIVVYDAGRGFMAAARLWWMSKWVGHDHVAVLNGGLAAWNRENLPVTDAFTSRTPSAFTARPKPAMLASAQELQADLTKRSLLIVDSRGSDRYRGENETIDPVAGHIPGAVSYPFLTNYADSEVKDAEVVADQLSELGSDTLENAVFYCGSGVTAAANILASAHAGLGIPRLYAGSWSHWITDPDRPVATGTSHNSRLEFPGEVRQCTSRLRNAPTGRIEPLGRQKHKGRMG